MLKSDEKTVARRLYPQAYSLQGFTTNFCQGCVYLTPSMGVEEDKRINTCHDCIPSIDRLYRNNQPIEIEQDEEGKNIARALTQ